MEEKAERGREEQEVMLGVMGFLWMEVEKDMGAWEGEAETASRDCSACSAWAVGQTMARKGC